MRRALDDISSPIPIRRGFSSSGGCVADVRRLGSVGRCTSGSPLDSGRVVSGARPAGGLRSLGGKPATVSRIKVGSLSGWAYSLGSKLL